MWQKLGVIEDASLMDGLIDSLINPWLNVPLGSGAWLEVDH
jgi:hypothetical protein